MRNGDVKSIEYVMVKISRCHKIEGEGPRQRRDAGGGFRGRRRIFGGQEDEDKETVAEHFLSVTQGVKT